MMGLLGNIGKGISKALDVLTVSVASPIKTAKAAISKEKKVSDVTKEFFSQSKGERVKDVLLGGAGIAATVAGGGALASAAKAGKIIPAVVNIAKSIIPSSTKGKIIAAVAAPVVIGAVGSQPKAAAEALIKAPKELAEFGGGIANFAANPSIESAKNLIKESPVLTAATGALIGGSAVLAAAPIIGGALQREAIQEQTKALESAITNPNEGFLGSAEPTLAKTSTITASTGTTGGSRKRKSKKPQEPMKISQKVNVVVSNRATARYLKTRCYN